MKVVFCDRDGTIIDDYPDNKWKNVRHIAIIPDSISALKKLLKLGYQIIIVTNQYLIDEGFISFYKYRKLKEELDAVLTENKIRVLDTFYCRHARIANCSCIKPKIGMVVKALKKYPQIDIKKSLVLGDSINDILLAKNLGIKSFNLRIDGVYSKNTRVNRLSEVIKYLS